MEECRRRSFADDYKRQAVDLVASSGRSVTSVANELGLRAAVLRRWVEKLGSGHEPTAATRHPVTQVAVPSADQAAEIARLRQENEGHRTEAEKNNPHNTRVQQPVRPGSRSMNLRQSTGCAFWLPHFVSANTVRRRQQECYTVESEYPCNARRRSSEFETSTTLDQQLPEHQEKSEESRINKLRPRHVNDNLGLYRRQVPEK
jgi:transposase